MIFWLIVGVALGYFFKPQLDVLVGRVIRMIRDNRSNYPDRDDRF
ncbi:MAG: hypothetical protein ACOCXF_00365 [bacterium]